MMMSRSIFQNTALASVIRPVAGRHLGSLIPKVLLSLMAFVLFAAVASAPAFCQTGQIGGRITDTGGMVISGARVTVTETNTGKQRVVVSNQAGYYAAPSLLPGSYSVSAELQGFEKAVSSNLELQVEQVLQVDFTLHLGAVSQTVVVSAQAPLLATETSSTGQVIGGRDVVSLPLLGRDAYALGELTPGVRNSIGMNNLPIDVVSTSSVSINGATSEQNDFLLDGAPNDSLSEFGPVIYPIADSVQQFKVLTSTYSAQYGRASGGIYDVVTKGGTNALHFSAYEFFRNAAMAANNWFSKAAGLPAPPLNFNQFGGVVGGPVVIPRVYNGHNKTFFFAGAEFYRYTEGLTYTGTVPTPAELTGDFSGDVNSAGKPITIYNPFTTTTTSRQAFQGNIIPPGLLNPVALKMASYFPKPNTTAVSGANRNNYTVNGNSQINDNEITARVDHIFSDKTSMFARYASSNEPNIRPNVYGNAGTPSYGNKTFNRRNVVIALNHAFSPSLFGTVRTSFSRITNDSNNPTFDLTSLGLPPQIVGNPGIQPVFPDATIAGYGGTSSIANSIAPWALGGSGYSADAGNTFAIEANVTKTFGKHELNVGTDLRLLQNDMSAGGGIQSYTFDPAFTQGPDPSKSSATAGDALASFLLGTPSTGNVSSVAGLAMERKYAAAYLEDDWKVTNALTLNLGVRYEDETPTTERLNHLSFFNPNASVPLTGIQGLQGALGFVGVDGNSRYDYNPQYDRVSPRVGFAWHLQRNTVVSGGGGLFYSGVLPGAYGTGGFENSTSMVTTLDGITPYDTLSNPYPSGLNPLSGSSLGSATLLGQSITTVEPDKTKRVPYAVQWNFGIQQQLSSTWSLDVRYVGTHGTQSFAMVADQLPAGDLALGSALTKLVPNPFYGQIATGELASKMVGQAQLLRPYPQFTAVNLKYAYPEMQYNALQVTLQKRFSSGISLLSAYTWSKMLDEAGNSDFNFQGEILGRGTIQNYYDLKAELSTSTMDQTHRLVSSVVYQLPFFRSETGITGHVLGGWELTTVTSFISGDPLGISSAANTTDSQGGGQRPNWNGQNPSLKNHTVSHWFNTSDFSAPPAFSFGNTPRTFNYLRSDWVRNIDLSLQKNTRLAAKMNLQIRVDFFNMDNTPTFAPPNTLYGSPLFGVVSAQQNQPRVIQLGIKLLY